MTGVESSDRKDSGKERENMCPLSTLFSLTTACHGASVCRRNQKEDGRTEKAVEKGIRFLSKAAFSPTPIVGGIQKSSFCLVDEF